MFTVLSPTSGQPDLTISDVTTYPIGPVVGSLTLSYLVHNLGNSSVGSHLVDFYFSTDFTLSSEDTYLGSNLIESVAPNTPVSSSKQVFFSGNPLGMKLIILKVDGKEEIAEINELNNLYSLPIFFPF